jgi:hypothetical protein
MPPPETTKASYLLLSAHQQRPIVAVIPYCDTSQCAFPTPEGLFIKLYRLQNKAISNKIEPLEPQTGSAFISTESFGCLSGQAGCLNLGLVPGCCILCRRKLPGTMSISFCSSVTLPRHTRELPIGHVKDEQQFSRRTLPKHDKDSWGRSLQSAILPNFPFLPISSGVSSEVFRAITRGKRPGHASVAYFPKPSRPSLGTVAVTKFNA